ncbi:MAG: MerR family transcriptional regulator [Proteobacteria bacterium]|nr:MerR family transcriptional regulator [Pseudomonadota bacterium]
MPIGNFSKSPARNHTRERTAAGQNIGLVSSAVWLQSGEPDFAWHADFRMQIGELSRVTGVSIPTIRVYEREGLIAPADRTDGRFRIFTETQRQRLDFIKRL